MRSKEIKKARKLRLQGFSIREISKKIQCAKSSVSGWVRDIPLTAEQIERLKSNQDKGRAKAANHPNSPKQVWGKIRNDIIKAAEEEIPAKCPRGVLKLIGAALYWAEGYKVDANMINFSNSDPSMVALMMKFFKDVCNVPDTKFRGVVHIHPHLDKERAKKFWSKVSGIPVKQFHKTQFGISKASKHKRDTLPLGTFRVVICDTRLKAKIKGWIQGIEKWIDLRAVGTVSAAGGSAQGGI